MGWQQDKVAYQKAADAKLSGVSSAKKAAMAKLVAKMQSGQTLSAQENHDYTTNFPEFFGPAVYDNSPSNSRSLLSEQDRGSNPMWQGMTGIRDSFASHAPASTNPGRFTTNLAGMGATGTPINTPGNSLASWPASTVNNTPGNSLSSWSATNYNPPPGPGNSLASWPAT